MQYHLTTEAPNVSVSVLNGMVKWRRNDTEIDKDRAWLEYGRMTKRFSNCEWGIF